MDQVSETITRRGRRQAVFVFDLALPWTYLTADAVAESFPDACWVAAISARRQSRGPFTETRERGRVQRAAAALGLRLAWPETGAPEGLFANRAAAFAAEQGRAQEFALAAARLAWAWGQDLDEHDVIADAAGHAGLPLDPVIEATFDPRRDARLRADGADGAPLLTTGGITLDGAALAAGQQARAARRD